MNRSVLDTWSRGCNTLYVGNLDTSITKDDLFKIFEQYGSVLEIDMPSSPEPHHKQSHYCFLIFERWESVVLSADNLNGMILHGRAIKVQPAPKYRK